MASTLETCTSRAPARRALAATLAVPPTLIARDSVEPGPADVNIGGGVNDPIDPAHGLVDRVGIADVAPHDFDVEAGQRTRVGRCPGQHADTVSAGQKQAGDVVSDQTGRAGHKIEHRSM